MTGSGIFVSTVGSPGPEYDQSNEAQARSAVQQSLRKISSALQQLRESEDEAYSLSNVSADRTFDADSTTTAELADVVGTLISDLQDAGIIG